METLNSNIKDADRDKTNYTQDLLNGAVLPLYYVEQSGEADQAMLEYFQELLYLDLMCTL